VPRVLSVPRHPALRGAEPGVLPAREERRPALLAGAGDDHQAIVSPARWPHEAQAVSEDSGGKLPAAIRRNPAASAKVCVIGRPASQC
jgi:hypothetical protein